MSVTIDRPDGLASAGAVIVRIAGEIGITSMVGPTGAHSGIGGDTALDQALTDALPTAPPLVVIDLNSATYLSSIGMGALLRFKKRLAETGTEVRLAGDGQMITLLRRCRLDQVFTFFPTVAAALQA